MSICRLSQVSRTTIGRAIIRFTGQKADAAISLDFWVGVNPSPLSLMVIVSDDGTMFESDSLTSTRMSSRCDMAHEEEAALELSWNCRIVATVQEANEQYRSSFGVGWPVVKEEQFQSPTVTSTRWGSDGPWRATAFLARFEGRVASPLLCWTRVSASSTARPPLVPMSSRGKQQLARLRRYPG